MALFGFDGASAFSLDAAKQHGGIVCSTYIRGNPGGFPHADKARVDAIRAHGMGAYPNWESVADFFRTATLADCRAAGAEALQACRDLGYPDDGSISCAFSFDFQMAPVIFGSMADKLSACQDGLGGHYKAVAYGQWQFLKFLAQNGQPGPHWLMASTFALPYDPSSPFVAMVQSHDVAGNWIQDTDPVPGTDINTVTQPELLGAWWPDNSEFAVATALTADDLTKVENLIASAFVAGLTGNDSGPFTAKDHPGLAAAGQKIADLEAAVSALTAAVSKLQTGGVSADAVAKAVVSHLGIQVVAK